MTRHIADLTGQARTGDFGIGAADLGYFVDTGRGHCLALFGDSFAGESPEAGGDWRSPVALCTTTADPNAGIVWDSAVGGPRARQLFEYPSRSDHGDDSLPITRIPSDGLALPDGRLLVAAFAVDDWQAGPGGTWITQSCDWFVADAADDTVWTACPAGDDHLRWPNHGRGALFQNQSLVGHGDHVYVFGTPAGRQPGATIHLMRAPYAAIGYTDAWQYWGFHDGRWSWGDHPPTPILASLAPWSAIGELNVRPIEGRLVMTYMDAGIVWTRVADAPDAPWSLPRPAITANEAPALYAPAIHPWSRLDNMSMGLSQWIRARKRTRFYGVRQWQINARPVALDRAALARRVPAVDAGAGAAAPLIHTSDRAALAGLVRALNEPGS